MPVNGPRAELIEAMARRAIAAMPETLRAQIGNVVLRVEELAPREVLDELGFDDPMELSGLYTGRPIGDKSVSDSGAIPDIIHLFRRPILAEAAERGIAVETLVAHVVVHEVGHHFGFSDDDMHWLEGQV